MLGNSHLCQFLLLKFLEQVHFEAKQDKGVCINCQEFGHITSMYPSGKIFTLIEKEDKLFKKQEVIYNKVGELVDRKDLSCINQGLIKQNKLKDEVSSLLI